MNHHRLNILRAADALSATVQDAGMNHHRLNILVAEKLLNCPYVVPVRGQVRAERVAKRVAADPFRQPPTRVS